MARAAITRGRGITYTYTHTLGLRTASDGVGYDGGRAYSAKVRAREERRGKNIAEKKARFFPVSRLPRDTHRHTHARRCAHSRALSGGGTIFCLSPNGSASAATFAVVVLSGSSEIHQSTDGGRPDVARMTFRWHNRRPCQSVRHLYTPLLRTSRLEVLSPRTDCCKCLGAVATRHFFRVRHFEEKGRKEKVKQWKPFSTGDEFLARALRNPRAASFPYMSVCTLLCGGV